MRKIFILLFCLFSATTAKYRLIGPLNASGQDSVLKITPPIQAAINSFNLSHP
jgi:hypothetical protein